MSDDLKALITKKGEKLELPTPPDGTKYASVITISKEYSNHRGLSSPNRKRIAYLSEVFL